MIDLLMRHASYQQPPADSSSGAIWNLVVRWLGLNQSQSLLSSNTGMLTCAHVFVEGRAYALLEAGK
jgi:hypothetical protein